MCFGSILEDEKCSHLLLILNIPILRNGAMQVAFIINEYKSCEIRNQMFFNVMFSFSKTKDKTCYDINIAKLNYLVAPFHI